MCEKKYTDIGIEIGRIGEKRTCTIPIAVESLGTVSNNHAKYLTELECNISALLGTASLLKRILY